MYSKPILASSEVLRATTLLSQLASHWIRRAPEPVASYTLGAATYLDAARSAAAYRNLHERTNPLLLTHFGWLYEKLVCSLTADWGPMEIHPELACPGFHIFAAPPGQVISQAGCRLMEQPIASLHVDAPYRAHMQHWSDFQTVDFLHPLSITLCLSLPEHGGGLNMWQEIDRKTWFQGHEMIDCHFNRHELTAHRHVAYQTGHVYVSSGHHIHQIAPAKIMLPHDRRMTLQAHAVKCDGIWRVFF